MKKETLEQIEEFAQSLHAKFDIRQVPVPVEEIAEQLNIRVKRAPSNEFSGMLLRKDGKALIGINSDESSVRQRFTIAHELGHFFLHPAKDVFVDYRDNHYKGNEGDPVRNLKERTANVFASAFLIPRKLIIEDVSRIIKEGIFESEVIALARKYEVSREAMNYRLLNLGLIK